MPWLWPGEKDVSGAGRYFENGQRVPAIWPESGDLEDQGLAPGRLDVAQVWDGIAHVSPVFH